jgi:hypothetical protein
MTLRRISIGWIVGHSRLRRYTVRWHAGLRIGHEGGVSWISWGYFGFGRFWIGW